MPRVVVVMTVCLTVVVAVVVDGAPSYADEPPEERAKVFYKEGLEQYEKKHYKDAIEAFKKSYALSEKPRLLFNIAQAYRLSGACQESLDYYRDFLAAEPRSTVKKEVKQFIGEMEACLAPKTVPASDPQPAATTATATTTSMTAMTTTEPGSTAVPASDDPGQSKRVAGLITGGVGIVLAGTSIYFGLEANKAADRVNARFEQGGEWTQEYQDLEAQGKGDQTLAIVLAAGGVVAIATGTVLYVWGARDEDVAVAVIPGGAAVTWGGRF
jgi:tetratricopeptide (TPR) repeat protein